MSALVVGAVMVAMTWPAGSVRADGSWLDEPLVAWNVPGMPVPAAPQGEGAGFNVEFCARAERPAETAEDEQVAAAGWRLVGTYQGGWGVKVITGAAAYDGMCRPLQYYDFVFVDGAFAGTVSPVLSDSRTDGALGRAFIQAPGDALTAQFSRYAPADPLCCPSRSSSVSYRIERTPEGPVLVPVSAFTQPTGN
jgi:LppP/LprE lipoprotein